MADLTARQRSTLAYISGYVAEHGHAPTVREISAAVPASTRTVTKAIRALAARGLVTHHPRRPRGLELVPQAGAR
ncbi:GntR family transcriptional regulator [Actinomadura bangladeshensis]|uniref:GntR family transcriptional regulator n=1 Tax=Actinomadura bangladeshensis TaxID=453573 RepID=A0A6L9Q926_9ACTN|nr:GntR family transcriptional regulator [Actinomadura bangladeshensis]NEA22522.1 GntR family transcriptional regulator [Actinomadura bangladeshensis]